MRTKTLYEVTLPDGRIVAFREIPVSEMGNVLSAGQGLDGEAANFQVKLTGLRYAIVEVAGKPVTPADLMGERWDGLFGMAETLLLMRAWSQIHEPDAKDADRVGKSIRVRSSGT